METSELDAPPELPKMHMVMELTIDSFTEQDLSQEQFAALAKELARMWTGQVMTKRAIITYRTVPVDNFVWLKPDQVPKD